MAKSLTDKLKDQPFTALGPLTIADVSIQLYQCQICNTAVVADGTLKHYRTHYPDEKAITLPIYKKPEVKQ